MVMEYLVKTILPIVAGIGGVLGALKIIFSNKVPKMVKMELKVLGDKIERYKVDTDKFKQAFQESMSSRCLERADKIDEKFGRVETYISELRETGNRRHEKFLELELEFTKYKATFEGLEKIVEDLKSIVGELQMRRKDDKC